MTDPRPAVLAAGNTVHAPALERGAAEAMVPNSSGLYRRLVESVSDYAIFMLDTQGRVLSWNAGAEKIQGYAAGEILGRHFSTFYPGEAADRGRPNEALRRAAADGRFEDEGWRIRQDGRRFWADVVITALCDEASVLVGFAAITRDMTARREAEEALRQSEEGFRLLIQAVQDYAIIMLDPEGNITSWNTGAERIKGYTRDEIVGRNLSVFYPEEVVRRGWPEEELRRAAADGRFEDEGWRIRKDGSRFWANVVITALRDDTGKLIGFGKVTRDLSARRQAEEQARRLAAETAAHAEAIRRGEELQAALLLARQAREDAERAAAAMTEAYRELDQFAYVASHDLKAPLRGIANLAQWIQDDMGDGLGGESTEHLRLLVGRVHRMEALIDGILAYSRAGRVRNGPQLVDTGTVVREAIELLAPPPAVTIEVPEQLPTLEAELVPLQQVFLNLLGNAMKFGSTERSDPVVRLACRDLGEAVEFAISDNGPGIAPEYHDRIWGIFQTLAPRDKVEGTGIGLSVVKKIVESRGGCVTVDSIPGQGATFRFTWPKAAKG